MRHPRYIAPGDEITPLPDPEWALEEPNGLLAFGGSLTPARLMEAYRKGIFPWYSQGQPVLWWSPDPRTVLFPADIHVSRSLAKLIRRHGYAITFDTAFRQVIEGCAAPRSDAGGTWILPGMIAAYTTLFEMGHAHSVEVWHHDQLVGGLYGVAVGKVFCGESMFSRRASASKVALVYLARQLARWGFGVIDTQFTTDHLLNMGAVEIARRDYLALLALHGGRPGWEGIWRVEDCDPLGNPSAPDASESPS
ncbi:MAG: leucyl/phenylalanyl-tRNA--protein transferase [Proteobacteria bacterium CG1_02_64_396]|nr:MAG: leucyl/phenylalanyl-tRNA--protein transferase [Proteobacteria bacterium CG1_02_64_396]